jgi:hypothetical protein
LPPVEAIRIMPDARSRPITWKFPVASLDIRADGRWLPLPQC